MSQHDGILEKAGKREKLENPRRVAELAPAATLARLGLRDGQTLCDIGAGSGLFSLAAARITSGAVWAADIDAELLAELDTRARAEGLANLHILPVSGCAYPIPDGSADWALLVTVLHEIPARHALLAELRRLLKPAGRAVLVEFHAGRTPMGPPPAHRLGAPEAESLFTGAGFAKEQEFSLGENLYVQTYIRGE